MLVLTRKLNEQIQIGDDVTVTVLRVKGNTIRLGIDAPRSTRVVRGELERFPEAGEGGGDEAAAASPHAANPGRTANPGQTANTTHQAASARPLAAFLPTPVETMPAELSA